MSITLDLPPKIEALLRQRAESTGQNISQMAIAVLTLGLSLEDQDFFEALNEDAAAFLTLPVRSRRGVSRYYGKTGLLGYIKTRLSR